MAKGNETGRPRNVFHEFDFPFFGRVSAKSPEYAVKRVFKGHSVSVREVRDGVYEAYESTPYGESVVSVFLAVTE